MNISIRHSDMSFKVTVEPTMLVEDLKSMIHQKTEINPDHQILSIPLLGKTLIEGQALGEYNIKNGITLDLKTIQLPGLQISVWIQDDPRILFLEVLHSNSVEIVKRKIKDKTGIPTHLQRLLLSGSVLVNSCLLRDLNIRERSELDLIIEIEIFIKPESGPTFCISVASSDTVDTLKAILHTKANIPPNQQKLEIFLRGKQLQTGIFPLSFYDITNDSTLLLGRKNFP